MDLNYKFSNILGGVYTQGNTLFTNDSKCLLSPVGNRISVIDLTGTKIQAAGFKSKYDIIAMDISPSNGLLVAADESGLLFTCSFHFNKILSTNELRSPPVCLRFSPDGSKLVVLTDDKAIVYEAPTAQRCFNGLNEISSTTLSSGKQLSTCATWSYDSRFFLTGAEDGVARLVPYKPDMHFLIMNFIGARVNLVGSFFEHNSMNIITVAKSGRIRRYLTQVTLDDLNEMVLQVETNGIETIELSDDTKFGISPTQRCFLKYIPSEKVMLRELMMDSGFLNVSNCDFHPKSNLLAVGMENGCFALVECPTFQLVHLLSISDCSLTSLHFNINGDWIAMACKDRGQLLVWDWQSEICVIKQQSHFNNVAKCAVYSPDSTIIASGGKDGRVKIWSALNGSCLATLSEHKSEVTGIAFKNSAYPVVITCSIDGTVRAFDLSRYRNFRTMTSPRPCQFTCVDIDSQGDLIAAGGHTEFEIYIWSIKTGHLLEVLTDHSGPVSSVKFIPGNSFRLASVSWDCTLITWDILNMKLPKEAINLLSEGLCVACNPDMKELAVSTLNANILFFDHESGQQTGSINVRFDIGLSRREGQVVTAGKLGFGRAFKSIEYSPDGSYIIAGGKTQFICIYHVKQKILVKRICVTANESIPGLHEILDARRMTRWGNMKTVDDDEETNGGKIQDRIKLPGTRELSKSGRIVDRDIDVTCLNMCPTGRNWLFCSSEGVYVYSVDTISTFEPFELTFSATPQEIQEDIDNGRFALALEKALRLNDFKTIDQVIIETPITAIDLIIRQMDILWIQRCLKFLATQIMSTAYFERYLDWIHSILSCQVFTLKTHSNEMRPVLCELQKNIKFRFQVLSNMTKNASKMLKYAEGNNELTEKFKSNSLSNEITESEKNQWTILSK